MKRYAVVSPEYGEVQPILDDGTGPVEYGVDWFEVDAENKRDALAFAVKHWLGMKRWRGEGQWVRDRRGDGLSPYAGLTVLDLDDLVVESGSPLPEKKQPPEEE